MSETSNAASNLLADLSAMLSGPTSADGTVRKGTPGMGDPVIAMRPTGATPSPQRAMNTLAQPAASAGQTQTPPRRASFEKADAEGTLVAYALKALTEEFLQKVESMTSMFAKLEERMGNMENTIEQHTLSINALSTSVDKNFNSLESTVKDVVRSVQLLKDKQELFEAQQEIRKATISTTTAGKENGSAKENNNGEGEETVEESYTSEEDALTDKIAYVPPPAKSKASRKRESHPSNAGVQGQYQQQQQQKPPPQQPVPAIPSGQVQFAPGSGFNVNPQPTFQPRPNHFSSPPSMQQSQQQAPPQGPMTSVPVPQQQMNHGPYSQGPPGPVPPPPGPPAPPPQQHYNQQPQHQHMGLPAPVLPPPPPYGARPPPPSEPRGGEQSQVSSSRVPIEKVVEDVAAMGFTRQAVRDVVRRLTENGQSVDLNIVLDQLMNGPGSQAREQQRPQQLYTY